MVSTPTHWGISLACFGLLKQTSIYRVLRWSWLFYWPVRYFTLQLGKDVGQKQKIGSLVFVVADEVMAELEHLERVCSSVLASGRVERGLRLINTVASLCIKKHIKNVFALACWCKELCLCQGRRLICSKSRCEDHWIPAFRGVRRTGGYDEEGSEQGTRTFREKWYPLPFYFFPSLPFFCLSLLPLFLVLSWGASRGEMFSSWNAARGSCGMRHSSTHTHLPVWLWLAGWHIRWLRPQDCSHLKLRMRVLQRDTKCHRYVREEVSIEFGHHLEIPLVTP